MPVGPDETNSTDIIASFLGCKLHLNTNLDSLKKSIYSPVRSFTVFLLPSIADSMNRNTFIDLSGKLRMLLARSIQFHMSPVHVMDK